MARANYGERQLISIVDEVVVIVVEDDDDIRHLIHLCLSTLGAFDVQQYMLASIAIKYLHEDTLPQMVLLDVMMPGMDGIEVCEQIRAAEKTAVVPVSSTLRQNFG